MRWRVDLAMRQRRKKKRKKKKKKKKKTMVELDLWWKGNLTVRVKK